MYNYIFLCLLRIKVFEYLIGLVKEMDNLENLFFDLKLGFLEIKVVFYCIYFFLIEFND